ncbi:MAG: serine/threonine protein kinase [Myxococcales bacterium]|nr:serine/threonine protein kinase [Myxococcales bacterium]
MLQCPHCSTSLADGTRRCLECGRAVDPPVELERTLPEGGLSAEALRFAQWAGSDLDDRTVVDPGAGPPSPTELLARARLGAALAETEDPALQPMIDVGSRPPPAILTSGQQAALIPPPPRASSAEASVAAPTPEPSEPSLSRPGTLPKPGEIIEGYAIEEEIGRGGMGRVYRATHGVTGQSVALKMLAPQALSGPRVRERFINEARVLAQLSHPNLVPLLNFIDAPSGVFIVMPYVKGITLEQMLRKQGRLALDVSVDLFGQLCEGVAHVHDHAMMHRDLKPANVIIRSDGRAMLTDFGIARELGAAGFTATGMVVGTAEYLAPEQASGAARDDPRSDLYSLAIMLYEMLTGRVPFQDTNVGQVLLKHLREPVPPPRKFNPTVPRALERVLLGALAKDPEGRPTDARTLRDAVQAAAARAEPDAGASTHAGQIQVQAGQKQSARRRRTLLWVGLALAAVYAIGTGIWWYLREAG